jgi:hypothetical protein
MRDAGFHRAAPLTVNSRHAVSRNAAWKLAFGAI